MDINTNFREQQRKRYNLMRSVKDIAMAIIILTIGLLMFFGDKFQFTRTLMLGKDPVIRYLFGGLCTIYGGFRLYRGIKQNY